MDVSIIIVSYNTKDLIKDCIASVKKYTKDIAFEIIVVDNASSDDSVETIKKTFKDVTIIQNEKNLGFSAANNIGIKKAKGKHILFLNSDTLLSEDAIGVIAKFLDENPKAGAATCRVELPTGEIDDASHRGFPTPWNAFCHFGGLSRIFPKSRIFAGYNLTHLDLNTVHEIDALAGAFMMVRRQAGEEVGWWDEDYFWYGEDIDFCYKLKEKGWEIYYVPTTKILHYKGVSGGIKKSSQHISSATKETKIRATDARFNAMRIFYKKHYQKKYPAVVTWAVMLGVNLRQWLSLRAI